MARAPGKIASIATRFGYHYSIRTAGHLVVIPSADGYLSVKSEDGVVIFAPQRIAVGISTDIILPSSVRSLQILFSTEPSPAPSAVAVHTTPEGTVQAPADGSAVVAIELKLKP
jgi:hypothetical protein